MIEEFWKPVNGFVGLYEASSLGRVRSVDRVIATSSGKSRRYRGRLLRSATDGPGYQRVGLWYGGQQVGGLVHRLVAEAFLREMQPGEEVNHIDFDKKNNAVGNLEIVSRKNNVTHATNGGRHAKRLTEEAVREIRFSALWGEDKYSAARRFGVTRVAINVVVSGKYWKRVNLPEWMAAHD